jgi:protein involved in polysaccharide export with SLBB domain
VHFPENGDLPPAIGFPIPVREDGSISLPLVSPIKVEGLTLAQAEQRIRAEYVRNRPILKPDNDRIIVTLMRPRTYHVLVVREDMGVTLPKGSTPQQVAQSMAFGVTKRGMTHAVELPAYENDVLHALSETGGLPGVDAKNEVTILRGMFSDAQQRDEIVAGMMSGELPADLLESPNVTRIPLRVGCDEPQIELTQDEITLHTGDIVFVESRETEVFYTGGLLPGGQFPLPRDYDIDVIEAMALAGGSVAASPGSNEDAFRGRGGVAIGAVFPPTRVIVLRKMNGEHIPIEVDLKRAMTDARERVRIVPGDFITLEYKPLPMLGNVAIGMFRFNYLLNGFD